MACAGRPAGVGALTGPRVTACTRNSASHPAARPGHALFCLHQQSGALVPFHERELASCQAQAPVCEHSLLGAPVTAGAAPARALQEVRSDASLLYAQAAAVGRRAAKQLDFNPQARPGERRGGRPRAPRRAHAPAQARRRRRRLTRRPHTIRVAPLRVSPFAAPCWLTVTVWRLKRASAAIYPCQQRTVAQCAPMQHTSHRAHEAEGRLRL